MGGIPLLSLIYKGYNTKSDKQTIELKKIYYLNIFPSFFEHLGGGQNGWEKIKTLCRMIYSLFGNNQKDS
jgi:hypothetical protein